MRKVLFVVDEKKIGGVNVVLENLLNNIDLKNLSIDLLVLHNTGAAFQNLNKNIRIIYGTKAFNIIDQDFKTLLKTGHFLKALRKLILAYRIKTNYISSFVIKQRKKMALEDYDVEIAFKAGFCSLFVAYSNTEKKINWVHEDYSTYNKTKRYENTFKKIFDLFSLHVVVSEDAAKSFNDIYDMEEKTCIIENFIDELKLKEQVAPQLIKLDNTKINIATLGRFCHEKGFDRLIKAVKILKDKLDSINVKVHILGRGELEQALHSDIEDNKLTDYVQIYNTANMKYNAYSFISACDLFVMPSRSESFGMTRVEALILGVPVLTTNVANSNKLIKKDYGIIVDNTIEAIVLGLEKIITDKNLLDKLKENVKSYSYSEKNTEIINKVQKLLEE